MYRETRLGIRPTRQAGARAGHGQVIKIATLNLKSLRKATMHLQIERYMKERDRSILCMQETYVADTTQYVVGDML